MKRTWGTLLASAVAASALTIPLPASAASADRAAPRTVDVRFGETVEAAPDQAVRLAFAGRRGQLVTLSTSVGGEEYPRNCESIVLSRGASSVVQEAPGFWRLPATGSYRLDYLQSCEDYNDKYGGSYTSRIALARVVVGRPGDPLTDLFRDRDTPVIRAVSVRLGRRPLLLTDAFVVPARQRTPAAENLFQRWCSATVLAAGKTSVDRGGQACGFRPRRGERYLVFGDKDTRVETIRTSRARLDGPALPVGDEPQEIRVSGDAGDVVYLETSGLRLAAPAGGGADVWLAGASGREITPLQRTGGHTGTSWLLPATGAYRLYVTHHVAGSRASVRMRSARVVEGTVGADFTVPAGRRWTLAEVDGGADTAYTGTVVATDAMAAGWQVRLVSSYRQGYSYRVDEVGGWIPRVLPLRGVLVKPGSAQRGPGSVTVRLEVCPRDPTHGDPVCPTG